MCFCLWIQPVKCLICSSVLSFCVLYCSAPWVSQDGKSRTRMSYLTLLLPHMAQAVSCENISIILLQHRPTEMGLRQLLGLCPNTYK